MVGIDCKNMTRDDKLSIKDLLIVGVEFVCAMACVPCVIAVAALIVTTVK
jgi:hypothetical protein